MTAEKTMKISEEPVRIRKKKFAVLYLCKNYGNLVAMESDRI